MLTIPLWFTLTEDQYITVLVRCAQQEAIWPQLISNHQDYWQADQSTDWAHLMEWLDLQVYSQCNNMSRKSILKLTYSSYTWTYTHTPVKFDILMACSKTVVSLFANVKVLLWVIDKFKEHMTHNWIVWFYKYFNDFWYCLDRHQTQKNN